MLSYSTFSTKEAEAVAEEVERRKASHLFTPVVVEALGESLDLELSCHIMNTTLEPLSIPTISGRGLLW